MIYHGSRRAFGDDAHRLVHIRNDAAVAVKEARIIHNDRCFTDLAHVIQRLGHRPRAGFLALDDFHQQHALDRREEVNADKLIWLV